MKVKSTVHKTIWNSLPSYQDQVPGPNVGQQPELPHTNKIKENMLTAFTVCNPESILLQQQPDTIFILTDAVMGKFDMHRGYFLTINRFN